MKKTIVLFLAILLVMPLFAQTAAKDKPASTQQPSDELSALQTANSLAKYGLSSRSASALICAAEILAQVQTQPLDVEGEASSTAGAGRVTTPEFTPQNLLTEAKKYAGRNQTMLAWIADVEKSMSGRTRGAVGGPRSAVNVLNGNSYINYQVACHANQLAEIIVCGNGATDLDLYIIDANGNIVAGDEDYTDDCFASFVPAWTGSFTVQIVNRGRAANRFELYTN